MGQQFRLAGSVQHRQQLFGTTSARFRSSCVNAALGKSYKFMALGLGDRHEEKIANRQEIVNATQSRIPAVPQVIVEVPETMQATLNPPHFEASSLLGVALVSWVTIAPGVLAGLTEGQVQLQLFKARRNVLVYSILTVPWFFALLSVHPIDTLQVLGKALVGATSTSTGDHVDLAATLMLLLSAAVIKHNRRAIEDNVIHRLSISTALWVSPKED